MGGGARVMTDIPGMIIWTDDYFGDTHHLTTFEHGAYLLILMAMWRNGGKLANSSKNLALLAHSRHEKWLKIEKKIMDFMTIVEGSNGAEITQKRLWQEYQLAQSRALSRARAGRLGGLSKALKNNKPGLAKLVNGVALPDNTNTNSNIKKDFLNGELRQERRWVPTKRIGSRLFKAGERAPAYDGQPPDYWRVLKPEDCQ
jgi:uncharacterized protein YdaU (DUF1376 family)